MQLLPGRDLITFLFVLHLFIVHNSFELLIWWFLDGRLSVACDDGQIRLVDPRSGNGGKAATTVLRDVHCDQAVWKNILLPGISAGPHSIVYYFSLIHFTVLYVTDGRLASAGQNRLVNIWELRTNKLQNCLPGHMRPIQAMCILPVQGSMPSVIPDRRASRVNLDLDLKVEAQLAAALAKEKAGGAAAPATPYVLPPKGSHVLVVGGTGMLSACVLALAAMGYNVSGMP
jgi:hypothetical protein